MEVRGQDHAPAALLPGKYPGSNWGGCCFPAGVSREVLKDKKSLVPAGIRTPDRPARSPTTTAVTPLAFDFVVQDAS